MGVGARCVGNIDRVAYLGEYERPIVNIAWVRRIRRIEFRRDGKPPAPQHTFKPARRSVARQGWQGRPRIIMALGVHRPRVSPRFRSVRSANQAERPIRR